MKRFIIITIILLVATALITVLYFKNLNPPGSRTSTIMHAIPDNAALVFEFNNEKGFYDIFTGNKLFAAVIGQQQLAELGILRKQLLNNPALDQFFNEQNIFVSFHPSKNNTIDLLLTTSVTKKFNPETIDELAKRSNKGLLITAVNIDGKKGYIIYSDTLKKRFYLVSKEAGIYSGSFSKNLIDEYMRFVPQKTKQTFVLLPDQQNSNSLANLYVNYSQLDPLFEQLFKNKNSDIFKSFRLLPALGVLDLNFKSDALMFSGFTELPPNQPSSYLNLFIRQQPVVNELKDIFPSTTAYSISFAVSEPKKFKADLSEWHTKAGLQHEKDSIFKKVTTETGINLIAEFNQTLGNEFAVVTTRYMEKFAIITLSNGSKLKPFMYNVSTMADDNMGQLNYSKLPYFLLGDAFSVFNRPWFMIVDNYLVLANSQIELRSYYDTYFNRKFQSKMAVHNQFNSLLTERSNVAWYINFKNSQQILKRDLSDNFYTIYQANEPGWKNFYAASYQLSASAKNFYTSFCMSFNPADSLVLKKQPAQQSLN